MGVEDEAELISGVHVEWPHGEVEKAIGSLGLETSNELWARQFRNV